MQNITRICRKSGQRLKTDWKNNSVSAETFSGNFHFTFSPKQTELDCGKSIKLILSKVSSPGRATPRTNKKPSESSYPLGITAEDDILKDKPVRERYPSGLFVAAQCFRVVGGNFSNANFGCCVMWLFFFSQ